MKRAMSDTQPKCDSGCCDANAPQSAPARRPWVIGQVQALVGFVPCVATRWTWRDWLGACLVRCNLGRMRYLVEPGLYAVGQPDGDSHVLVSANYKLSFDHLRRALDGLDAWILVVDTHGINVWCAAGKGTFGTEEVVHRLTVSDLVSVVTHSTLILPQLAAPGVAAHTVRKRTGYRIVYGPVRAKDIPEFLDNGMKATPEMRRVSFTLQERLAVVSVELVQRVVPALVILLAFCLAAGLGRHGYRLATAQWPRIAATVWVNFFAGIVLVPALLPWLPGRAFALKGAAIGVATGVLLCWGGHYGAVEGISVALLSVAACSFLGLTFTGSTPYTSASGVRREMVWAIPAQITAAGAGLVLWLLARFI